MNRSASLTLALLALAACSEPAPQTTAPAHDYWVYFGTGAEAVYVSPYNSATGEMGEPQVAAEILRPNFLAVHPNHSLLYAVARELPEGGEPVDVTVAFKIDQADGKLERLGSLPVQTTGSCHLNVDATGKVVAVANYAGGAVTSFALSPDGSLTRVASLIPHQGPKGPVENRQDVPHAHSVNFSPDNRFVAAADLGLDRVYVYAVDTATGELSANDPPFATVAPGSGPRHFTFHPNGRYAYVINELASTVTAFAYDAAKGVLTEIHTITTLPEGVDVQNTTAEVLVHPSGKFLYGSNRGHNSLAVFSIDEATGRLTPAQNIPSGGDWPRNFRLDPAGNYLYAANQQSNNIVQFRIDRATGALAPTGATLAVESPMCIRFVPAS